MSPVDRSRLPVPGPDRPFRFPRIAKRMLPSGLELRAVSHHAVPITSIVLLVPGGSAVDPSERPGLTSITANLLDEGSRGQTALEVADRVARIGGDLDIDVSADACVVSLTTLDRFTEAGVALVHEMVTAPNLAAGDFDRVRQLRIERLRQLKDHAPATADRVFARVLYGDHPYGHLGLGTTGSLEALTLAQVTDLHAGLFVPDGATLVISGDRDAEALLDTAEAVFGKWRATLAAAPIDRARALAPIPDRPPTRLGLVHRDGAAQSELRIGQVSAPRSTPDYHALVLLNAVLGGQFVSRLNLNLREDKGYTYGVRTSFDLRRGVGPFVLQTSVGTDVTAAAVRESLAELRDIAAARPPTPDELALACASVTRGYPRGFETATQVARSAAQLALHRLPDSYFDEFIPSVTAITVDAVAEVAARYLAEDRMSTVIVGDAARIGASLQGLGLGNPLTLTPEF